MLTRKAPLLLLMLCLPLLGGLSLAAVARAAQSSVAPEAAQITISKTPDIQQVLAGQAVTFTIQVTNTGDVLLTQVEVSDPQVPACDRAIGDLAVDDTFSYECSTAVETDFVNEATVTAQGEGEQVQATDAAQVDVTPSTYIYEDIPALPAIINGAIVCYSGNQIFREYAVTESFIVGDVNIGLNITHTHRGDVWAFLISPTGTRVELTSDDLYTSADANQNYDMMLDQSSTNPQDDETDDDTNEPYYDRDAKPFRSLDAFNGENAQGTWKLEICDKWPSQWHGTYNRSRLVLRDDVLTARKSAEALKVQPGDVITYSVAISSSGAVLFGGITLSDTLPAEVSYLDGTLSATSGIAVAENGLITWTGDLEPWSEVEITYATEVITTSAAFITNTAQISHPILGLPMDRSVVSQVFVEDGLDYLFTNETDIAIPDGYQGCITPISSTIWVEDDFYIGDVRVGLTLDHTLRGDLAITLTGPMSIAMTLLDSVGFDENFDGLLSDAGPENIFEEGVHDTSAPYYDVVGQPSGNQEYLRLFDGEKSRGLWTLWVCDDALADTGTLRQWSLFFKEAHVWLGYTPSWHTATNWGKGTVPDSNDFALILPDPVGGYFPVLDADAAVGNLMLKGGASTDLATLGMTVEDYVSNSGLLSQTLQVTDTETAVEFLHITDIAASSDKYRGLVITPTVESMGDVTVGIRGNQSSGCTTVGTDALLTRCYRIEPTVPTTSTLQFYFLEGERNGQNASLLKTWDRGEPATRWDPVGANYVRSAPEESCGETAEMECWLQSAEVNTYPALVLGSASPPTVTIRIQDGKPELSWTHSESGVSLLQVWRSANPFFSPAAVDAIWLADLAVDPNGYVFVDQNGGVGSALANGFYIVRTVYTSSLTTDANRVAEYDFDLAMP